MTYLMQLTASESSHTSCVNLGLIVILYNFSIQSAQTVNSRYLKQLGGVFEFSVSTLGDYR